MLKICLLIFLVDLCCCYKVHIYSSKFGFSHMNYLGSIADTLQAAGNNVTVLQPVILKEIRGTGCHLAKVLTVAEDEATLKTAETMYDMNFWAGIWTSSLDNPLGSLMLGPLLASFFNAGMRRKFPCLFVLFVSLDVLSRNDIMNQLRREKFDVAIFELFDYGGFPVFHELGIKTIIGVDSTGLSDKTAWAIGNPIHPALSAETGYDGSFTIRLKNFIFTETMGNMPFTFTNTEPLIDFPKAKLHKVIDLGGIGLKSGMKLDENWLNLLSQKEKNVLISFGSVAPSSTMPAAVKENIVKIVKKFPEVTFIWKYETPEDGLGKGISNLHLTKWTPQTDLLASGQIDLFITHGGAGSVLESASSGVPIMVVPLFGDQRRNGFMAERFGYGMVFDKHLLSSEVKLETATRQGLESEELKTKAKMAKELLESRPFSPQELLIRHVDLAVKFGEIPSLAPSGRHFSIVQYHNLDIVALAVTMSVLMIVGVGVLLRRCLCSAKVEKVKVQ